MIKFKLLFICVFYTLSLSAQISYPKRLKFTFVASNADYIQNWNPSNDPDDHFHRSQVPLKERFNFTASQADQTLNTDKKYLYWRIDSDKARGANIAEMMHSGMEYRDIYCLWVGGGGAFELPPAQSIDLCHDQGVKITANITFADGVTSSHPRWADWLGMFEKDANGNFIHTQKIAEICKHYGLDGLSLNWEVNSMTSSMPVTYEDGKEWLRQLRSNAANLGMTDFEVIFYYVWYDNGVRSFGIGEISDNSYGTKDFLGASNDVISTGAFINYNWGTSNIDNSVANTNAMGRSPFDVYYGLAFYGNSYRPLGKIKTSDVSIGCWGEAIPNSGYPSSTNAQKALKFVKDTELYMNGPNNDPSNPGAISSTTYGYRLGDYGVCTFVPVKSAIQSLPWFTNFSIASGDGFYYQGKEVNPNEWHDVSLQEHLPHWRWWWSAGGDGLTANLDPTTVYSGSTSLGITGNVTATDNVLRLYKTKLLLNSTCEARIAYKVDDVNANVDSHLELALAFENGTSLSAITSLPIGQTTQKGWNTAVIDLSQFAGQTVAVIGVNVKGAKSNYSLNIGEIAITHDDVVVPTAPINVTSTNVNVTNGLLDVKLTWELPNNPRYNEDANVNHFEIYQVNGDTGEKSVIGLSKARGFIANDIPVLANNSNLQFEVVSVANDNFTKSSDTIVTPPAPDEITLATGTVMANNNWQTITLDKSFTSMVVVATPVYSSLSDIPGVVRIKNVTTNSFDIKLQSGNTTAITTARKVYYLAVEEGVYTEADHGVKMEAVKASTSATSFKWNWNVEARQYNNSYTNPVVVGQVMTENDADFSHFWISSGNQNPITASSFNAGLLVDEHLDTSRASETIGYVIFESGTGSLNNRKYVAQNATGITSLETTSGGHTVNLPSNELSGELYGFATINGMVGSNGGWANLYTADGLSTSAIKLTLDEDQFSDSERKHIGEKVCYLVIDNPNAVAQKSGLVKNLSNDKLTQKELKLYPNPTNGILNISGVKANSNYEIYNITGAKIRQGVIGSASINIEDVAKGIYWIRIIEGTHTHTRKIVKH